jgi:hypothetical protein
MGSLRIQSQEIDYRHDAIAQERRRLRAPIVSVVLAAYVTVAALQPQQILYFVVLAPVALIALQIAFEIADKLDGR